MIEMLKIQSIRIKCQNKHLVAKYISNILLSLAAHKNCKQYYNKSGRYSKNMGNTEVTVTSKDHLLH